MWKREVFGSSTIVSRCRSQQTCLDYSNAPRRSRLHFSTGFLPLSLAPPPLPPLTFSLSLSVTRRTPTPSPRSVTPAARRCSTRSESTTSRSSRSRSWPPGGPGATTNKLSYPSVFCRSNDVFVVRRVDGPVLPQEAVCLESYETGCRFIISMLVCLSARLFGYWKRLGGFGGRWEDRKVTAFIWLRRHLSGQAVSRGKSCSSLFGSVRLWSPV